MINKRKIEEKSEYKEFNEDRNMRIKRIGTLEKRKAEKF